MSGAAPAEAPKEGAGKGHGIMKPIGETIAHAIGGFAGGIRNALGGVWDAGPGQVGGEIARGAHAMGYKSKEKGPIAKTTGLAAEIGETVIEYGVAKPLKAAVYLAKTPFNMVRTAGRGVSRFVGGVGHAIGGFFGAFVPKSMKEWWKKGGHGHAKEEHHEEHHEKKDH